MIPPKIYVKYYEQIIKNEFQSTVKLTWIGEFKLF